MKRLVWAAGVTLLLLVWGGTAFSQAVEKEAADPAGKGKKLENPKVLMKTSMGDITLELFRDKAPITVQNFLSYAADNYYDGTVFHRVIAGFMIQGGGRTADLALKTPKAPIRNEANNGLQNKRGTIAMARLQAPHTASSQFFINLVNNDNLNYFDESRWGYCVFGEVVKGMDVVDKIADVKTGRKEPLPTDVPLETVLIESVRPIEK